MRNIKNKLNCQPRYMGDFENKFYGTVDSIKDQFIKKMDKIVWKKKGIFFTEAIAFCSFCKLFDVNLILESGVRNGDSTEMWLNYFGNDFKICSVDEFKFEEDLKKTKDRLSKYHNLDFIKGDGCKMIPKLSNQHNNHNIGILLDGPKGYLAMKIAEDCFKQGDHVKFVAIHDMGDGAVRLGSKDKKAIIDLRKWNNCIFNTDSQWYRDKYKQIDNLLGGTNNKDWEFYKKKYPIGCGMAFIVNTRSKEVYNKKKP